jgi:formate hydrogenlyase transcriptional activator
LRRRDRSPSALPQEGARIVATTAPLVADLVEHEREILEAALRQSEGVVGGPTGAAVKLGIPRQTLDSKIRKLGINRHRFKAS